MTLSLIPAAAIVRRVAIAGAVGLTGLALGAPAASAGRSQSIDTKGGYVRFEHRGDGLLARDDRRDGYSVSAEVALLEGIPIDAVEDADGALNMPNYKRSPFDEGTELLLRLCYVKGNKNVSCSDWQRAQA
jgi:hypothetical protein